MLINFSRYLSTFLMIVICGSITQAQTATASSPLNHDSLPIVSLIQISEGEFKPDGHTGPLHEFGYLFESDPELRETFNKFNDLRLKQRRINNIAKPIIGIGTILTLGALVGLLITINDGFPNEFFYIIGITVSGGLLSILNKEITGSNKNRYRSKLLSHTQASFIDIRVKKISLNLALTQNGVGLVYQF